MSRTSHYRKKVKPGERKFFVGSIALMFMASFALTMGLFTPAQAVDNTVAVPPVPSGVTYDYPCGGGSGVWTGIPADADFDAYDFKFDDSTPQHLIVVYTDNPIDGKTFPNGTDTYDYGLPADAGMTCQPQDESVTPTAPTASQPTCDNTTKTVTPDSQSGAIVWDPSGATDLQPGDSVTYTASPADGFVFPDGADTSFPFSNNFDTSSCDNGGGDGGDTTPEHVKASSLSDHSDDCEESGNVSGQLNVTDPSNVVQDSIVVTTNKGTYTADDLTFSLHGNVLQIVVPLDEDEFITDATIEVNSEWGGQFVLSHYTCGEQPPPPPNSEPGTATAISGACSTPTGSTGTASVKVENTADDTEESVTYDVTLNAVTKKLMLADGATDSVTFTGLAPGDYDWTVTGPDGTDVSGKVAVKQCETPPPPPNESCPQGYAPDDLNGNGVIEPPKECIQLGVTPPDHPRPKPKSKPKPTHLPVTGFEDGSDSSNSGLWFLTAGLCALLSLGSAGSGVVIRRRQDGA